MAIIALALKVKRPGHTERWHAGARQEGGPRQTSEGCNVDQAHVVEEVMGLPPFDAPRDRVCRRCFPTWPVPR